VFASIGSTVVGKGVGVKHGLWVPAPLLKYCFGKVGCASNSVSCGVLSHLTICDFQEPCTFVYALGNFCSLRLQATFR
jgi:hypothetical protein